MGSSRRLEWFGGGYEHPGIHSVAVDPRSNGEPITVWFVPATRDELRVPVEARLVVTRTRDGGKSFEVLSEGLPRGPAYDLVYGHGLDIDASGTLLAMGSTTGNLWIWEDSGDSWTTVTQHLPPNYAVRIVPD